MLQFPDFVQHSRVFPSIVCAGCPAESQRFLLRPIGQAPEGQFGHVRWSGCSAFPLPPTVWRRVGSLRLPNDMYVAPCILRRGREGALPSAPVTSSTACWMKNTSLNFQNLMFIISCRQVEINDPFLFSCFVHKIVNKCSENKTAPA